MLNFVHIGVGALGRQVLKYALERENLNLSGVSELNPELHGIEVGDLLEIEPVGVKVSGSLEEALETSNVKPEVAVITTVSSIKKMVPQIREAAEAGLSIVTTCEELSYPWNQHPAESAEINEICTQNGVSCLGTGVNPGFLMDYLPTVLTSIAQNVEHIEVERIQDASARRIPFQKKIGAALTPDEFEAEKQKGTLRHVGLPESADMIAAAMNWDLDNNEETLEPVLAIREITEGYKPIEKGRPAGVEQIARGTVNGKEKLTLRFRAAVGEEKSYDRIKITGRPNIESVIEGGVNGDIATCAITVNALRSILRCEPGLKTMLDVPVPAWFGTFISR